MEKTSNYQDNEIENPTCSANLNKDNDFLNQKSNRNKSKHKHPNKKKLLLHQLEFYFSDINLLNDKFLRTLMNKDQDKGVDINIILNFNKVKSIINGIDSDKDRINFIKKAVENSKKIKIMQNKIVRAEKFEVNKLNTKDIDKKTIYVQNIPNHVKHETLQEIFSKFGRVLHVSIPKFADTKLSKGFAFVTFDKISDVDKAIVESNNTIPRDFISLDSSHDLEPLYVISKNEWLAKKDEFKKLRQELINENKDIFADCFRQDSKDVNSLTPGTLVKLLDLPSEIKIDKFDIKTWISNFIEPAYVDYNPESNECIVRFSHKILAESFANKINNEDYFQFHNKKLRAIILEGDEETDYFNKVKKLKEEFGKKKLKNNLNKEINLK